MEAVGKLVQRVRTWAVTPAQPTRPVVEVAERPRLLDNGLQSVTDALVGSVEGILPEGVFIADVRQEDEYTDVVLSPSAAGHEARLKKSVAALGELHALLWLETDVAAGGAGPTRMIPGKTLLVRRTAVSRAPATLAQQLWFVGRWGLLAAVLLWFWLDTLTWKEEFHGPGTLQEDALV